MTARRAITAAVILFALALLGWWVMRVDSVAPGLSATPATGQTAASNQSAIGNRPSAISERSPLADALNSPATDIHGDLRLVTAIVETFRTNFPKDGNPVGSNAEITAALTGKNKLRLSLIPPDHPAINQVGELCDHWGTPFFFHAESATRMEVRSAGPDKKMWTTDDVVFAP